MLKRLGMARAKLDPLEFGSPDHNDGGPPESVKRLGAIGALLVMAAGAAVWTVTSDAHSRASLRDERTLCLVHARPPVAVLAMFDVTDRLAAGSGSRFGGLIQQARQELPRDGRLTILPFDGDLGRSSTPIFDRCSPGRASDANEFVEGRDRLQRTYERRFSSVLDRAGRRVSGAETSRLSPIAAQIMRAVNDPAIQWNGARRELTIYTDGLENTPASRIYAGAPMQLPQPPPDLLLGVTVNYVELANPRFSHLQTAAVRETWRRWFEAAGAHRVNMWAPGFASPSRTP